MRGIACLFICSVVTMELNAEIGLLSKVVEDHDVGIHVKEIVSVWWVFLHGPLLGFWTLIGENVIAVFGLIIHAVKPCHLLKNIQSFAEIYPWPCFALIFFKARGLYKDWSGCSTTHQPHIEYITDLGVIHVFCCLFLWFLLCVTNNNCTWSHSHMRTI